MKITEYGW